MNTAANNKQIGGTHYQSTDVPQHWDIVIAMGWDYLVGNATKYIWRLGKKHPSVQGQLEDINKAIHYLEKKREILQSMNVAIPTVKQDVKWSDPINGPE